MKEERKRILKMVEDGKLSVDEALMLLEELEEANQSMEEKKQEIIHELSTAVKFEEAKKEEPFNYKFQSAKEKIIDFVDTAFKKIKDFDLDFNFGQSVEISHIFQQSDAAIKDIDLDLANGIVKIMPWDQPDVRIECTAKVFRVETQEEARRSFLKEVNFIIDRQKLRFSAQQKWMKVNAVVYLPEKEYENVKIRMFNGTIDGSNLSAENCKAKTANGKITFHGIKTKSLEADTVNGQILIQKGEAEKIEAETLHGDIIVNSDFKKADLQSFNGDVFCTFTGEKCEIIDAKSSTGGIDILLPARLAVRGDLKTNLGSFDVALNGIQILEEKSEVIQKILRFTSIEDTHDGLKLFANTKTGSVRVKSN